VRRELKSETSAGFDPDGCDTDRMAVGSPAPASVRQILTGEIEPNPHNPRRLFDEEPLRILEESIQKLGILVPITVYEEEPGVAADRKSFVILDGERRWRCAQELEILRIPAIVVERPSEEQNILTMFHIHNVREGWQLMPTALKLQTLIEKLGETNERTLSELTKLSIAQIRRCKILLTYPKSIQNMMLAPLSERMKADFFIELQRIRGPALNERFPPWVERGDHKATLIVLDKYNRGVIRAVTEFRHLAEIYRASQRLGLETQFMHRLDRFLDTPDLGIDDVEVPGASFSREAKEIRRSAHRLYNQLDELDLEAISSDDEAVEILKALLRLLEKKLNDALLVSVRDATTHED
jgi:ParB/RepB/Spo0J family partition protein